LNKCPTTHVRKAIRMKKFDCTYTEKCPIYEPFNEEWLCTATGSRHFERG